MSSVEILEAINSHPCCTLASRLPTHPLREQLNEVYLPVLYGAEDDQKSQEAYEVLAALDGFKVVEERYVATDRTHSNACHYYMLSEILGRSPSESDVEDFASCPEDYLIRQGYFQTFHPTNGAVALYCDVAIVGEGNPEIVRTYRHYGLVVGPQRVVSKWDYGYVLEHPTEAVPCFFGDGVVYFEKL